MTDSAPRPLPTTRPLCILKTGDTLAPLAAQYGDFEDWISAGLAAQDQSPALPLQVLDARKMTTHSQWPVPSCLAGLVITGSHAMVTDRAGWSERAAAWLARVVAAGVPVLGICYGHQLLAHALGGEVHRHPGGMEVGTVAVQRQPHAKGDVLFGTLPATFAAHAVHEQSVRRLPPGAVVLAANAHEPHHAFRVGSHAWGVQFHPEFSEAAMQAYVQHVGAARADMGGNATSAQPPVRPTPEAHGLLRRFARHVQAHEASRRCRRELRAWSA